MRVRGLVSLAAGVLMAVTLTACGSDAAGSAAGPPRASDSAATSKRMPSPAADRFKSVRTYATVAPPTRLRIPAIDLVTPPLDQLGLQSSLRLITCGGQFDYQARNYLDNVIVFASPA